jgi:hypothetical protein
MCIVLHDSGVWCLIYEHIHAQNYETNGSIELLQLYVVVAADVLLEIGMA